MNVPDNRTKEVNRLLLETVSSALHEHARPGVHGQVRIEAPRVLIRLHHKPEDFRDISYAGQTEDTRRVHLADLVAEQVCARVRATDARVSAVVAHFQDGRVLKYEVEI